jgi:MIP family channel proteins
VEASEPGTGRAQDTEAEVEAAAAVGDIIPERGPAAYLAEFIGTFALVLFITWVVSEIARPPLGAQEIAQGASPPFIDFVQIGLVHVFVLFMLIQTLAVVSGAHFNPVITVALTAIRQIRPIDAAIYVVVQLAGGVLGALVTKLILKADNFPNAKAVHWGAVSLSDAIGNSTGLGMLVEGIGAFFLVWAVVGVAVNPAGLKDWSGFAIGATLGLAVMIMGPLTGAAVNPARAFGPAIVSHHFGGAGKWLLTFVLAPGVGGVLAAAGYFWLFIQPGKKGVTGMEPVG